MAENPAKQVAALRRLAGGKTFVARLSRIFWPAPAGQDQQLARDFSLYSQAGFAIELQLRYHPDGVADPDPAAFAAWAADLVGEYDGNPALVSVQVTNEVNVRLSPDSSDGAYPHAQDALIDGVEGVHDQVARDAVSSRVKVGFNWFYRTDPVEEAQFWDYLAAHGGDALRQRLDWVGVDAYPGTAYPPAVAGPRGYYDAMTEALQELRTCFMPEAGIGSATPIYVEESGYPTEPPLRPEKTQATALVQLVQACLDHAASLGVTDFRWFDLRDADSASPNLQQHYGLLRSDYAPKPAFATYARLVQRTP